MSIIYDALKKVDGRFTDPGAQAPERHWAAVIAFLKIGLLAVSVLIAGYILAQLLFSSRLMQDFIRGGAPIPAMTAQQTPPAPVSPAAPQPQQPAQPVHKEGPYVLNGIFSADNAAYALVNNTIVQVGDTIGAAKVAAISANSVDLEENGRHFELVTKK